MQSEDKNLGYKKCIIAFYMLFLLIGLGVVLYKGVTRGALKTDTADEAFIDYEARYPFAQSMQIQQMNEEQGSIVDRYKQKIASIKQTLEWYCTDGFLFQQECVEVTSFVNRISGQRVIQSESTLMNLHDGYIVSPSEYVDTTRYAENVISFGEYCDLMDIPCLYVESLFKVNRNEKSPFVRDDYTNRNTDSLLEALDTKIKVLDLRDLAPDAGETYEALFFRTDTHWLPETGLWATGKIIQKLNSDYNLDLSLDNLDVSNFERTVYSKRFLGSLGRNVGLSYAGLEDFTLLTPTYRTRLHYYSEAAGIDQAGDFSEALIDYSHLESTDYYNNSCYAAYMNGRQPLAFIENELSDNDIHILLLSDSFGATVAPFLALDVARLDFIDPRLFNGSIEAYIAEAKPDIVVMMYNPEVITRVDPDSNDSVYMLK